MINLRRGNFSRRKYINIIILNVNSIFYRSNVTINTMHSAKLGVFLLAQITEFLGIITRENNVFFCICYFFREVERSHCIGDSKLIK